MSFLMGFCDSENAISEFKIDLRTIQILLEAVERYQQLNCSEREEETLPNTIGPTCLACCWWWNAQRCQTETKMIWKFWNSFYLLSSLSILCVR